MVEEPLQGVEFHEKGEEKDEKYTIEFNFIICFIFWHFGIVFQRNITVKFKACL